MVSTYRVKLEISARPLANSIVESCWASTNPSHSPGLASTIFFCLSFSKV